jgi:hypothetical protein
MTNFVEKICQNFNITKPWQQLNETSKANKTLQPQQMKNEELGSS